MQRVNELGIYNLMGGAFMANSVKVENKKLNISGYSNSVASSGFNYQLYFVSTWFSNISLNYVYAVGFSMGWVRD